MHRKRKAENKFKNLLEKAIMTYADKASVAYSGGAKSVHYFSPPITKLIFFLVYNHKMIEFLKLKHEAKKERRLIQKKLMEEDK
jgi:hypothetical protein